MKNIILTILLVILTSALAFLTYGVYSNKAQTSSLRAEVTSLKTENIKISAELQTVTADKTKALEALAVIKGDKTYFWDSYTFPSVGITFKYPDEAGLTIKSPDETNETESASISIKNKKLILVTNLQGIGIEEETKTTTSKLMVDGKVIKIDGKEITKVRTDYLESKYTVYFIQIDIPNKEDRTVLYSYSKTDATTMALFDRIIATTSFK